MANNSNTARIVSAPNAEVLDRIRRDNQRKVAARKRAAAKRRRAPLRVTLGSLVGNGE